MVHVVCDGMVWHDMVWHGMLVCMYAYMYRALVCNPEEERTPEEAAEEERTPEEAAEEERTPEEAAEEERTPVWFSNGLAIVL